mgnify:CR=1 FL=1
MATLERAIEIAREAHAGQVDKAGKDYINHPLRVMEKAGITYLVTKLDFATRTEPNVPINEMASSRMARRTVIGNIYKLVKDPNLFSVYLERCCNCYC